MILNKALSIAKSVCFLIVMLAAPVVLGDEHEHESAAGHEASHDYHRNLASFLIGVTGETRREYGTTLGIGYERRVTKTLGVGVLAERTYGDLDFWVYAVPFAYRTGRWKLLAAPGVEDGDHGTEFLFRLGAEYAIEIGEGWEIAPQLSIDFVGGEELGIIGVSLVKGF